MKTPNKIILRHIRKQLGSFLSIIIIVAVAFGFYVIMKTITDVYKSSSDRYYTNNALADYALYGQNFTDSDVNGIKNISDVTEVAHRSVLDARGNDNTVLRIISITSQEPKINIPYLYSGDYPKNISEGLLLKKFADANKLNISDYITFNLLNDEYRIKITGLMASPEYAYLTQNSSSLMSDPKVFGVMYVSKDFFVNTKAPYPNEILVSFKEDINQEDTISKVKSVIDGDKFTKDLKQRDFPSYDMYQSDLREFQVFAYVFPIIFLLICGVVIFVVQKRSIVHDRRQIGIMKALGLNNRQILWYYAKYSLLVSALGIGLGSLLTILIGPPILNSFTGMIEVPGFIYRNIYVHWIIPIFFSITICLLSSYIAVKKVVQISPSEAMRSETPKSGKDILLQKTFIWRKLSFNSRYSIKSALRNKGRFWAVVLGMVATITLAVFSMGFMDSFNEIIIDYYSNIARYDLIIRVNKTSFNNTPSFIDKDIQSYEKILLAPVKIGSNIKKDMTLYLSDGVSTMNQIKNIDGNKPDIKNGVAIPKRYAELLNLKKGDNVRISTSDKKINNEVTVSDITMQNTGFVALSSFEYAKDHMGLKDSYYNTIYVRTIGDIGAVKNNLEKNDSILSVSSKAENKKGMDKLIDLFRLYIYIMIFFAIVLGVATLYSISTINLLSRNYEFVLLKVIGYRTKNIMVAYTKELISQAIIAIPVGFLLGNLVVSSVSKSFSNDSLELVKYIYPSSYFASVFILVLVTTVVLFSAAYKINRLDLVEGLKSKEE